MKNSVKMELKMFFSLKILWIGLAVLCALTIYFSYNSYAGRSNEVNQFAQMISENMENFYIDAAEDVEYDYSSLENEVQNALTAYQPQNILNNSFSYLLGFGLIFLPIIGSLFIGIDYSRRSIKLKSTSWGLPRIIFSKLIAMTIVVIGFLMVYSVIHFIIGNLLWSQSFAVLPPVFANLTPQPVTSNYAFIPLTLFNLLFCVFLCMLVSFLFKSSIPGIIMAFVLLLIRTTSAYIPLAMFAKLNNSAFFLNSASTVSFPMDPRIDYLPDWANITLLLTYFSAILLAFYLNSRRQKN